MRNAIDKDRESIDKKINKTLNQLLKANAPGAKSKSTQKKRKGK